MLQGIASMTDAQLARLAINQTVAFYDGLQREDLVLSDELHMRLGLRAKNRPDIQDYSELAQQGVYGSVGSSLTNKTLTLAHTVAAFACNSDIAGRKHSAAIRTGGSAYSASPGGVLVVPRINPGQTDSQKIDVIGAVAGPNPDWCKTIAYTLAGIYAALWRDREQARGIAAA